MATTDDLRTKDQDEVLKEIRKIKDDLARNHGYDLKSMIHEARTRQRASGHRIIPQPKRTQVSGNERNQAE